MQIDIQGVPQKEVYRKPLNRFRRDKKKMQYKYGWKRLVEIYSEFLDRPPYEEHPVYLLLRGREL